jgi:hypothetical protein
MKKINRQDFLQVSASRGMERRDVFDSKILDFQAFCRVA